MSEDIDSKIDRLVAEVGEQAKRLDAIFVSTEKTRKYFLWTLIVTGVMVALPLIGLVFAVPFYLQTLSDLGI